MPPTESNEGYVRAMFGENAVHVPAWFYVQHQAEGVVSFVGASRSEALRFGSDRTHQFVVGELIVRPHRVVATDALRGQGLSGLMTGAHDLAAMLAAGELLVGP